MAKHQARAVVRLMVWVAVGAGALAALFAANLMAARMWPGGEALRYPWEAMRAFLFHGENPYHRWALLYGWALRDGAPLTPYVYPFHAALLWFTPLALVDDFLVARALAMTGTALALLAAGWVAVRAVRWQPGRWMGAVLVLFAVSGYFSALAWWHADVAGVAAAVFMVALSAMLDGRDDVAGGLLAIALIKPGAAGWAVLFLLLWAASARRWKLWRGFLEVSVALLALAFWLLPSWWLGMARLTIHFGSGFAPLQVLAAAIPGIGKQAGWLILALVVLAVGSEWWAAWGGSPNQAVWAASLTVTGALLAGRGLTAADQVFLLLPIGLVWMYWSTRWKSRGAAATAGTLAVFWALPWLLWRQVFLQRGGLPALSVCFAEPLVVLMLLYTVRWWAASKAPVGFPGEEHLE